ncbi:MAG: hypothetical protein N4A74_03770 [Carboxylicivirga sp.]|jgi:hypothetical protein|nr:hypothetical protein [Carboxylicivirga sp.]
MKRFLILNLLAFISILAVSQVETINGNLNVNGTAYFSNGIISRDIITHPDNINTSGFYRTNTAPLRYFTHLQHPSSAGYAIQIGNNYEKNELYFRAKAASAWGSLYKIWHSGNSNSGSIDWNAKNFIAYNQNENIGTLANTAKYNAFGVLGNRGSLYITNSGDIRFGIGSKHGNNNVMYLNNTGLSIKTGAIASEALEINGNIKLTGNNNGVFVSSDSFTDRGRNVYHYGLTLHNDGYTNLSGYYGLNFFTMGNRRLTIQEEGNIGIGTTSPSATLDVAGNIKAHEIEVTLAAMQDLQLNGTLAANNITYTANGNTADFVFEDNYHLKDLSEVEAFIKTNKHLPKIPSAAEMEEVGVNLAEMNKLLLMKVEELTLYLIKQERDKKKLEERLSKIELMIRSDI